MIKTPCDAPGATADHGSRFEPSSYAAGANQQIHGATQLLVSALNQAVEESARLGAVDTGARHAAAALIDATIAVHQAVTAAGRALSDRDCTVEVPVVGLASVTAA
jgi:hypothetical protein